jgi:hypothetical protein
MNKNDKVLLYNRGQREIGSITKTWQSKGVQYYNVLTERGIILQSVTTNPEQSCFIEKNLTQKDFEKNKLSEFTLEGQEERIIELAEIDTTIKDETIIKESLRWE